MYSIVPTGIVLILRGQLIDRKAKACRRALKSIMLGSGAVVADKSLPESWAKPVVDSAVLSTHAQTSLNVNGVFATSLFALASVSNILDAFVPTAEAIVDPTTI